jgi:glucan phosphoethanolaminetransferase (alkaline phosphatase superfamily)
VIAGVAITRARIGFALLVSLAYVLADDFALFRMGHYQLTRQDVSGPLFNTLAFVGSYLSGLLALILLHAHARAWIRYASYVVAVLSVTTFFAFSTINSRGFTVTEANLFWSELEFAPDAIVFYFWDYLSPLLLCLVAVALLEWLVRTLPLQVTTRWVWVATTVACVLSYQLLLKTDSKVDQFPIPIRVPVLIAHAFGHQSVYLGTREDPFFAPVSEPIADHIVFIVDESIRGDALSLNGTSLPTTPYLESIRDQIFNYGVASSVANLSAPSNIVMQSGLRLDQLPDTDLRSMKNPTLFAYMRAAGFGSYFINAQNILARPPNFMTDADIEGLDGYLQVRELEPGLDRHEPDHRIPAMLRRIVSENARSFSDVIKNGAHFPYGRNYPQERAWFEPAQFLDGHSEGQASIIAEYMNTVRWTVDEFVRELLRELDGSGESVLVIYTSDHGQSLFEWTKEGDRRIRGHGHHESPPTEQAMIPLLLLPRGAALRERIAGLYDPALLNRISAYELFSTMLYLAGYDYADISRHYAPMIFDSNVQRGKRVFVSGNHFGRDGPLYRDAPYKSSFSINEFDPDVKSLP